MTNRFKSVMKIKFIFFVFSFSIVYSSFSQKVGTLNALFSQVCLPEFPFKDGWLGGDCDVSVQLSNTQTLFIFSDTYVGNKNQQSRLEPGMKMVSNTVEVETCLPGGKTDIHYFWNNMYADNPGPIFKSFTNRYRYWVNDAFMYKTSLYIVLEKISPKQGAAPD